MKKSVCLLCLLLLVLTGCHTATIALPSVLPTLDFSLPSAMPTPWETPEITLPPTEPAITPTVSATPEVSDLPTDAPSEAPTKSPFVPEDCAVTLTQKYPYETMMRDLAELKSRYPSLIHYDSSYTLGRTSFGREIPYLILGNPNAARKILLHAAIHAREYISAQVLLRSVEMYCEQMLTLTFQNYTVREMLDAVAVYVVPMMNPDGVNLVNLGISSVPEEYRSEVLKLNNNRADFSRWKANGLGTDLNSNWGPASAAHQKKYPAPAPDGYAGTAFSAPETQALKALLETHDFESCTAYHTQGRIIYWYYGQTGALKNVHLALAKKLRSATGYSLVEPRENESYGHSEVVGQKDWFVYAFQKPGFTVELGRGSHPLPIEQIEEILQAVWMVPACLVFDTYCDLLAEAA